MSHIAIIKVKAVAEAPELGQGDTESKEDQGRCSSCKSSGKYRRPGNTRGRGLHSMARLAAAVSFDASAYRGAYHSRSPNELAQCQIRASRMIIGMGTPNSQSRIPRPIFSSYCISAYAPGDIHFRNVHGMSPRPTSLPAAILTSSPFPERRPLRRRRCSAPCLSLSPRRLPA
jgi:hypothetical protein